MESSSSTPGGASQTTESKYTDYPEYYTKALQDALTSVTSLLQNNPISVIHPEATFNFGQSKSTLDQINERLGKGESLDSIKASLPPDVYNSAISLLRTQSNMAGPTFDQLTTEKGESIGTLDRLKAQELARASTGMWTGAMQGIDTGLTSLSNNAGIYGVAQPSFASAGQSAGNIVSSAAPSLQQAGALNIPGAAAPYLGASVGALGKGISGSALQSAAPYLTSASGTSVANVGDYMNPYTENVMDVIAQRGARNLKENLLPNVSDAFIRAGQFGSSGMGDFGERAVRDTQEAILAEQAKAAQQGYTQALTAAGTDLSRLAGLGQTAGTLSGEDLSRAIQGGAQLGTLGNIAGQLTASQMQGLTDIGKTYGTLTTNQANAFTGLGQAQASAMQQDVNARLQAMQQLQSAQLAKQQLAAGDVSALQAIANQNLASEQAIKDKALSDYAAGQTSALDTSTTLLNLLRGNTLPTGVTAGSTSSTNPGSVSPGSQVVADLNTVAGINASS